MPDSLRAGTVNMVVLNHHEDARSSSCIGNGSMRSIFHDCQLEADRFKWIESERAGYDLGEGAIHRWVREHWWGFLRHRWLEHLQGTCFWTELDRGDFGLLQRNFTEHNELLNNIVERLKDGKENLDIITWAKQTNQHLEAVIQILEALDINSRRLVHRFDPVC